jgi:hypothetical protein
MNPKLTLSMFVLSLWLVGCGLSPTPNPDSLTPEQATILAEMMVDDLSEALENLYPPAATACITPSNPAAADTDGDGVWDQLDFIYACSLTLPSGQIKTLEGKKRISDPDGLSNANLTPGMDSRFLEHGLKILVSADTPQGLEMVYTDLLTGNFSLRPDGTALSQRFTSKRLRTFPSTAYAVTSSLQLSFQPTQAAAQTLNSGGKLSITGRKVHTISGSEPINGSTLNWGVSTPIPIEHSPTCSSQPYVGGEVRLERIPKPESGIHAVAIVFEGCGSGYRITQVKD